MVPKKRISMGKLAGETAAKVDQMLSDQEADLISKTTINWESLRLKVTDKATFDKLVSAVEEATRKNENIAQLKERVQKLGSEALKVARQVVSLIK